MLEVGNQIRWSDLVGGLVGSPRKTLLDRFEHFARFLRR
jgi:hypothetical protein